MNQNLAYKPNEIQIAYSTVNYIPFRCFILSNCNYCPVTWHFCSEQNTKKIEKINDRALKFIYSDYHISSNYLH
jgi:hypothetical protein